MKIYILILLLAIGCSLKKNENLNPKTTNEPVQIDNSNITKSRLIKNTAKNLIFVHVRGYDFYQSRYVIPYDEKNKEILKLYKKNNLKEITTIFSFSNLNKDTIFSFPILDNSSFPVFGNKYKNAKNGHVEEIIDVYLKIYNDDMLGSIAIIDSVR